MHRASAVLHKMSLFVVLTLSTSMWPAIVDATQANDGERWSQRVAATNDIDKRCNRCGSNWTGIRVRRKEGSGTS